ncbi:MAG: S53 family peptidase [Solirubrobacteraceae bacterium]
MRSRGFAALVGTIGASFALLALGAGSATAAPYHSFVPHRFAQPPTTADCESQIGIECYQPFQLQRAYDMDPLYHAGLTGTGKTIVLVDSYGSPTINSDLTTFDDETNLPAPPSFKVIQPAGSVPPYDPTNYDMGGWGFETSLDVEYAHAMAPGANILLVETPVDETLGVQGFPQMVEAENYVIDHRLGDVISQSFGATEQTFPSKFSILALRSAYFNALFHRVTVLSASGDGGATDQSAYDASTGAVNYYPFRVDSWPSSDPLVTSVGGTQLHLDANGNRTAPDNVWNDTALLGGPAAGGGGVSTVFARPFFQSGVTHVVGSARGNPDVSMSAAVDGGVVVYLGYTNTAYGVSPGWYVVGGTSEATPVFSGIVAIADQAAHHDLGWLNPTLYALGDGSGSGIADVTAGNNSVFGTQQLPPVAGQTFSVSGFDAESGYDLASGLGTADGARLVGALAGFRQYGARH